MHGDGPLTDEERNGRALNAISELLERLGDPAMVSDENRVIYVNDAFAQMVGYSKDEILGSQLTGIIDVATLYQYRNAIENSNDLIDSPKRFRMKLVTKNGGLVMADVTRKVLATGGRICFLSTLRDITQQVQQEDEREKERQTLKTMFESSPVAYFILSRNGIVTQVNDAAARLLGHEKEKILRSQFTTFLFRDDRSKDDAEIVRAALGGSVLRDVEMRLRNRQGEMVWVLMTSSPLIVNGELIGTAVMVNDVTRRKMAEQRAQEENERSSLYLEILTHDLNNLNHTILVSMGLLEELLTPQGKIRELIDETEWVIRRATRTIESLKMIRTLADSTPPVVPIAIEDSVNRAIDMVREDFPNRSVEFEVHLTECPPIAGNEHVDTALFNVIHNAVMFCNRDVAHVAVRSRVSEDNRAVDIMVEDNGPGIPDTMKELIFKRSGHPDSQSVGRGLSLTLVNYIMKGLGGSVWAEDRVAGNSEMGARLVLRFPVWVERAVPRCGRPSCIIFYKSEHCVFCPSSMAALKEAMATLNLPTELIVEVDVDDPSQGIRRDEIPVVPAVRLCDSVLTGIIDYDTFLSALMNLSGKECLPLIR
ncbi:MAG: PAS domain S-box protein [Candidatus Thorarchaeota archaeon]